MLSTNSIDKNGLDEQLVVTPSDFVELDKFYDDLAKVFRPSEMQELRYQEANCMTYRGGTPHGTFGDGTSEYPYQDYSGRFLGFDARLDWLRSKERGRPVFFTSFVDECFRVDDYCFKVDAKNMAISFVGKHVGFKNDRIMIPPSELSDEEKYYAVRMLEIYKKAIGGRMYDLRCGA